MGLLAGDAIWARPDALRLSSGYFAPGNVTGHGWSARQHHSLLRPGVRLPDHVRMNQKRRDRTYDTTDYLKYMERVESLPFRGPTVLSPGMVRQLKGGH